jgi:hypothetical protein
MSADNPTSRTFSLRRWSQRKLEAARAATEPAPAPAVVPAIVPAPPPADVRATEPNAAPCAAAPLLPPIESLTIDSDFTAFFAPKVDEALKRKALKQLFRDPRFNVMDGLDTYIDDYSQPDPISPEIVREMVQGRYIFDPPKTRVNEQGTVEDVPPDVTIVESNEQGAVEDVPPDVTIVESNEQGAVEDVPPDGPIVESAATEPGALLAAQPVASTGAGVPTDVAKRDAEVPAIARAEGPPGPPKSSLR